MVAAVQSHETITRVLLPTIDLLNFTTFVVIFKRYFFFLMLEAFKLKFILCNHVYPPVGECRPLGIYILHRHRLLG